jgi:hypothetical protein
MPQKITAPTAEQLAEIKAYCERHNLGAIVAGRIAWARLLAKPPKAWEIEDATVQRGTVANLKQYQEDDSE